MSDQSPHANDLPAGVVSSTKLGVPASANERYLRRLLAVRVGMPGTYYDDGEAYGTESGISIDFMREPVADIDAKLRALNVARAEIANPAQKRHACDIPGCAACGNPERSGFDTLPDDYETGDY